MGTKTKTLIAIAALGLLDAVALGLPIMALILVYVVLERPPWFLRVVREIYGE
ncbi:MAG: hypothetical protein U9R74_18695 [Pseudomonadota bacterium]|nr:hypothetical protein [Pseudomonadota bacterium]